MELIIQPEGSAICGQCCVAMIAGVSLEVALLATPREEDAGTRTSDLVEALRLLHVPCDTKLRRVSRRRALPPRCIVHIRWRRSYGHWMLMYDGKIYDPGNLYPDYPHHAKILSYLEIFESASACKPAQPIKTRKK